MKSLIAFLALIVVSSHVDAATHDVGHQKSWKIIASAFDCPPQFSNDFGKYVSPLNFTDGHQARTAVEWQKRRQEIIEQWTQLMGAWPPLLKDPRLTVLSTTNRENFVQQRVRVDLAPHLTGEGYLLTPLGAGPFPAVLVPFYEPETSIGWGKTAMRDFALQLTRRGFVTLSIGSPGGDARRPELKGSRCQPLSFLAYVAANCHTALSALTNVDARRIGVVGHSYGGKWAMFASCLYEPFACAAWSDPGIVFDETRSNVNYWEPWYLGLDPGTNRAPGVLRPGSPRTGPYKRMIAEGRDLHELHALMAPRPFLVSGGAEDPPERWRALNHSVAVNSLLGATNRVAMTTRSTHDPTAESNEALYSFFEYFLK